MATLWYCCGCKFGPHNSALYDYCINCGTMRCQLCVDEKATDQLSSHSHCNHTTSPYPSAVALDPASILSLDTQTLPHMRPLPRPCLSPSALSFSGGAQVYSQTYMYICCQCNDGPKVYNVQPRCVTCQHDPCSDCVNIK